MKFNHSLQFNAVPEWVHKYIDYSSLKKLIYNLEKDKLAQESADLSGDVENEALIETNADETFAKAINSEVHKVDDFFAEVEHKLNEDLDMLLADEAEYTKRHVANGDNHESQGTVPFLLRNSSQDGAGVSGLRGRSNSDSNAAYSFPAEGLDDYKLTLKKRAIGMFVSLSELKSFAELNKTGVTKALKKYRKTLNSQLRETHLSVDKAYVFAETTEENMQDRINESVNLFARLTGNNHRQAAQQLRLHLREHVVWERNTVWRDMIGMERRQYAATTTGASKPEDLNDATRQVKIGGWLFPSDVLGTASFKCVGIAIIFLLLVTFPMLESVAQSNCLAVVVAASLLWATEAMPLFVTSLMIPLLVVVLRIPLDEKNERMLAEDASRYIFSQMWSSVIMLLLGGFTLAAALSKYEIAKKLATAILSRSGTNPRVILLNLMFVAAFLSMWISNVAAPVLCYSIAQPLLRTLGDGSPFAVAIVLGIALASNVGGMVSPIASPQNIIALENMSPQPSWAQWFLVAIPVSILSILLIWGLLIFTFRGTNAVISSHVRTVSDDKLTSKQWFIIAVSVGTIVLWILSHPLANVFGEMGVIALIPIVLFFGTGLLTSEDFNNFLWTIIALAMGGIALGKAVSSSGLLHTVATHVVGAVEDMSLYGVTLTFGVLILFVATFISHTVAALIILPLVASIGQDLANPRPNLLVMASALLCSGAMGLPTSGFPNVTAICMTDELGKPYLTVGIFIKRGVLASVLVYVVVNTVGYAMMNLAGF